MGTTNDDPQADAAFSSGGFTLSQEPVVAASAEPSEVGAMTIPVAPAFENLDDLPASYGEDSLFLIARDPHWLFAYWDFDWMKIAPVRGHAPLFFLRVVKSDGAEDSRVEIRPEARNWYVPVIGADTEYFAELGYLDAADAWQTCVRSRATRTPANSPAPIDLPVEFGAAPGALSYEQLIRIVREQRAPGESLTDAVGRLTNELRTESGGAVIDETVRARVLAAFREEAAAVDPTPASEMGVMQSPSWPPQSFAAEALGPSWPPQSGVGEVSGPSWPPQIFLAEMRGPSWPPERSPVSEPGALTPLHVEVVIRAGVAPDARVTIDGRPVGIEPDGSFRLQLQMAGNDWTLPFVVRSADGSEMRSGRLSFARSGSADGGAESLQPLPQWTGFA